MGGSTHASLMPTRRRRPVAVARRLRREAVSPSDGRKPIVGIHTPAIRGPDTTPHTATRGTNPPRAPSAATAPALQSPELCRRRCGRRGQAWPRGLVVAALRRSGPLPFSPLGPLPSLSGTTSTSPGIPSGGGRQPCGVVEPEAAVQLLDLRPWGPHEGHGPDRWAGRLPAMARRSRSCAGWQHVGAGALTQLAARTAIVPWRRGLLDEEFGARSEPDPRIQAWLAQRFSRSAA